MGTDLTGVKSDKQGALVGSIGWTRYILGLLCILAFAFVEPGPATAAGESTGGNGSSLSMSITADQDRSMAGQRDRSVSLVSGELLSAVAALSGSNVCFAYAYDRNDNRTSLSAVTYNQTGTWGSSTFGCFSWTQGQ